jgi:hypothetical protein
LAELTQLAISEQIMNAPKYVVSVALIAKELNGGTKK